MICPKCDSMAVTINKATKTYLIDKQPIVDNVYSYVCEQCSFRETPTANSERRSLAQEYEEADYTVGRTGEYDLAELRRLLAVCKDA